MTYKIDGQQTKAKQIAKKKAEENKQKPKSIELTGLRTKAKSVSGADSIAAYTSDPTEHIPLPRPKRQKAKKKPSKNSNRKRSLNIRVSDRLFEALDHLELVTGLSRTALVTMFIVDGYTKLYPVWNSIEAQKS